MGTRKQTEETPTDDVAAVLRKPDVLAAVVDARDVQDELVPEDADGCESESEPNATGLLHAALLAETGTDAVDGLVDDRH